MRNTKLKKLVAVTMVTVMLIALAAACNNTQDIGDAEIALGDGLDVTSDVYQQGLDELNDAIDEMAVEGSESEEMGVTEGEIPEEPAIPVSLMSASAPGTVVHGNERASIDASNMADGYVMIRYNGTSETRLKVLIDDPAGVRYNYDLKKDGSYEIFPFASGNGSYTIGVYQQRVEDSKYATLYSTKLEVTLRDEFAPFLQPNQYVNFNSSTAAVSEAARIVGGETDALKKVELLYTYVINNFTYDYDMAQAVIDGKMSGYVPDLDSIWNKKSGICFDYAATLTAMLRSQGVPTKLVFGNAGDVYHAWINVYSETEGWVDAAIFFNGKQWKLMDPTFASTAQSSAKIMDYIGNGANYSALFQY